MSGYTPLFDTALDGTLFGKWPHTGIWCCLLSQADKHGVIDKHPNLLAAKIGTPLDVLLSCLQDFMQPDPGSRTRDHDGRRLELLDPEERDWGWRIVNHALYRERARLQAKNAREVEEGRNAARLKDRSTAADRRPPPETAADRLSNTNTNTDEEGGAGGVARSARASSRKTSEAPEPEPPQGLDPAAWKRFAEYRSEIRKPIKPASVQAAQRKLAGLGRDQAAVVEQSIAQSWTGLFPLKDPPKREEGRRGLPTLNA
jgi:hypothetical protein